MHTTNNVHKYLSVGTPHEGTPQAYPFWSAGDISHFDWKWKRATSLALAACRVQHGGTEKDIVHQHFPVVKNLLPSFDYLLD